jgi:hypothetical protein
MDHLLPQNFPQLLARLTFVPMVAAGVIGLVRFRHFPLNLRYLTGLLWFVIPMNFVGFYYMLQRSNNLFLMPAYAAVELLLLAVVYGLTLHSAAFTRALPWVVSGFVAYVLFDSLLTPTLLVFRPGQQVIQGLLVLVFVGLYFRKLLNELHVQDLKRDPMFWVSGGLFFYFSGYLLIALFSNFLLKYNRLAENIWAVNSMLFILLYSCYSVALWLSPKS